MVWLIHRLGEMDFEENGFRESGWEMLLKRNDMDCDGVALEMVLEGSVLIV